MRGGSFDYRMELGVEWLRDLVVGFTVGKYSWNDASLVGIAYPLYIGGITWASRYVLGRGGALGYLVA